MAEFIHPPAAYDDLQQYRWKERIHKGIRQRAWACGEYFWPRQNLVWGQAAETDDAYYWYSGIVASVSEPVAGTLRVTVTDNGTWAADRWHDFTTDPDSFPEDYDLIFHNDDAVYSIHGQITDSGTDWIEVALSTIRDALTYRGMTTADFVADPVLIIKRGGISEAERVSVWGNVFEEVSGAVTSSAAGSLADSTKAWTNDQHNGKTVLFTAAGVLTRTTIIDTTAPSTITFATGTPDVATDYCILPLDLSPFYAPYFEPGRKPGNLQAWYAADVTEPYASHSPVDDSIVAVTFPKQETLKKNAAAACADEGVDVFDVDLWVDMSESVCYTLAEDRDQCLTPNFFKGERALQVEIERLSGNFIEDDWEGKKWMHAFTRAYWFSRFMEEDYDWFLTTITTNTATETTFPSQAWPVAFPSFLRYPFQAYFDIRTSDGEQIGQGLCTVTAAGEATGILEDGRYPGCTIRFALSWRRVFPLEFMYLYPACAFIADVDDLDILHPDPDEDYPGHWDSREPSTTYYETTPRGVGGSGAIAFVNDYAARYRGDWIWDPTIGLGSNPDDPYWDKLYQGKLSPANQAAKEGRMSGTATAGSVRHLEDNTRSRALGASTAVSWWDGTIREETGTADGGSTTALSDSTKVANWAWAQNRHYDDAGNLGYNRFAAEVSLSGVWTPRPVTSHATGATETLTFLYALPSTASGQAYRIREHLGNLNLWRGRDVVLTWPSDGFTVTVEVAYSDDFRLYFAADLARAVDSTTTYRMIEDTPGGVYMRDTGEWVKPNQTDHPDTRGSTWPGTVCPWLEGDRNPYNLPHEGYHWGRLHIQDYVNWSMLAVSLVPLKFNTGTGEWTSREDPDTPEDNFRTSGVNLLGTGWANFQGLIEDNYLNQTGPFSDLSEQGGGPHALIRAEGEDPSFSGFMKKQWAYFTITDIPTRLPCVRHVAGYAGVRSDDPDLQTAATPATDGIEYDNNGDHPLAFRAWGKLHTSASSTARRLTTAKIGSHNVADWMAEPTAAGPFHYRGYFILQAIAVFEWEFDEPAVP